MVRKSKKLSRRVSALVHNRIIMVIGIAILLIAVAKFGGFLQAGFNASGYGQIYTAGGLPILEGDTISESFGLKVVMTDMINSAQYPYIADLYCSENDMFLERAAVSQGYGDDIYALVFTFNLNSIYKGSYLYVIKYSGGIPGSEMYGVSYSFRLNGDNNSPVFGTTADPIIDGPDDKTIPRSTSYIVSWTITYDGLIDYEIYLDGALIPGANGVGSLVDPTAQIVSYTYPGSVTIGSHIIKITLTCTNGVFTDPMTLIVERVATVLIDPPLITSAPATSKSMYIGNSMDFVWKYTYQGASIINFYRDNVLIDTRNFIGSVDEQTYTYSFIATSIGNAYLKFELIPNDGSTNLPVLAFTSISITTAPITTTTTTTTTTTPSILTPTNIAIVGGVLGGAVIIVIFMKRRASAPVMNSFA